MIKLKDLLVEESAAAKQAKAKGLKSKGFGNWADSSGKVVAQTKDDKLVMTKKAKEPSEKKKDKKADMPADYEKNKADFKKKVKDKRDADFEKGDVGGPAHPNVPKKDSKKKDVKKKTTKKKTTSKKSTLNPKKAGIKEPSPEVKKKLKTYKKPDEWNADNVQPQRDKKGNIVGFVDPGSGHGIDASPKDQEKIKKDWDKKDKEAQDKEDAEWAAQGVDAKQDRKDAAKAEKDKKKKPKKKKWTPKDGEANRPVSKAQQKRETKAKPKTVHDRGNGHFAGKNPDGNVQGFHGDYAEESAELYSQGVIPNKKKAKALKYKKDLKKAGWDPNDKSGKSAFAVDGGGTAWDEMMDGETPSKSWWSDLMDSFAKEAGELETK